MKIDMGDIEKAIMRATQLLSMGMSLEDAVARLATEHGERNAFLYVKAANILNGEKSRG